ncbi:hypothetical protein MUDAN_DOGOELCO_02530 [Lactiplantibacillus mudanjiangensis]|uniref:hypothetical protein n=1 Tax=Lactiplantibacillus mudanjiangensis TaxID=1296538 RepID=UPI00101416E5|nr:hypothetical protein [Lactiplantibacillus mudanjiangensis]VDG33337.1 hypothetical protein MUDAN_DOGOELCO_02530 [Lactiplantibacillus mudanjiangensis]
MEAGKLHLIADSLDGLNKSDWNTLKQFIDETFEKKAIKENIVLGSSEVFTGLKGWIDD